MVEDHRSTQWQADAVNTLYATMYRSETVVPLTSMALCRSSAVDEYVQYQPRSASQLGC
jgi:hypothetical protein